ncbi:hypothetical protein [Micromonospora costi]|uniref:Uncharacterized protein n=1 Tax=Micromonospora costi TaxID=1530042 RepID=A0A3A9ZPP3_9ACTN|nr:hypothetical protein [Micromonospora costi]RKN50141.1 hypothetical protein D7193_30260 [Micromonospora costi]
MTRHEDGRADTPPRLVRDAVRDVVADVAPDELVLVDALRSFDDDTALRRLARARGSRDLLGFGLGEVTILVTSLVWVALDEVVRSAVGAGMARAGTGMRTWLRARLGRPAPPRSMPALTGDQLRAVRDRVCELAVAADLTPDAAALLADRVVARLATSTGDGSPTWDGAGFGATGREAPGTASRDGSGTADRAGSGTASGDAARPADPDDGPASADPDDSDGQR